MNTRLRNIFTASFLALSVSDQGVVAFCLVAVSSIDSIHGTGSIAFIKRNRQEFQHVSSTSLHASPERDDLTLSESSQTILGVTGTVASLIVFYSEFTLKTTGCGVPAGPFGLFGLAEGLSYLGVTGLVAYSLVTKVKTVSAQADHRVDGHCDF